MKSDMRIAQKGFSLLEAIIVIAIIFVVAGMAVLGIQNGLGSYKADAAADAVSTQLRTAREVAIAKRRWVQITIDPTTTGPNAAPSITYQVITLGGETPQPAVTQPLPAHTQFYVDPTVPDTPMGFGNGAAVEIGGVSGGPPSMYFSTTGSFVVNQNPFGTINGTIFIGTPNQKATYRAVTILGATGRVRTYYYSPTTTPVPWRE
ncbi:MAG TPA: prepilin-type N-terminal cleavage/methylation domain-containing protein [Candidatus Acidoferrum sp.]|nr:prepilin-type N-terminal cleavage/methylation domain-containing protein [Candidatus Acidoferrum sp.]